MKNDQMSGKPLLLLLSLLLNYCTCLSGTVIWKRPRHMPIAVFGRPFGGFLNHPLLYKSSTEFSTFYPNVITDWLPQKIDNFNPNDNRVYKQRYMYNMEFYNNSALAFVMIGGESQITENWIGNPNYTWMVYARKHGAACFQPEHRYFGPSQPFNDTSVESYKYFTIDQALADLKNFILQMNKKFFANFTKPRWVVFGGSYPGGLAAWFREMNEDITIASMPSSGVVQPRVNYWDYAKNVQYVLNKVDPNCTKAVRLGMNEAIRLTYTTDGRKKLKKIFNFCEEFPEPPDPKDVQNFLANLFYLFEDITQYTGDNRDLPRKMGLGVPKACKIMTNENEESYMQRIKNVLDFYNSFYGSENQCNDFSYKNYMKMMNNTKIDPKNGYEIVAARGWTWISCTELGYFQTTENGKSIFGSSVPLDFYADQCMDLFGKQYDTEGTREGVQRILCKYGGYRNFNGTRTVFANGEFDPWKSVSCLNCNDTRREVYSVITAGGAHCVEMYPANHTHDSVSLRHVRAFLEEKLDQFIAESSQEVTTTTTTGSSQAITTVKPGAASVDRKSLFLLSLSVMGSFITRC